jgi:hypothetical protein
MADKFEGATPEELSEYVNASAQQAGEKDEDWARRVQRLEADLLAQIGVRAQSVKDDPREEV